MLLCNMGKNTGNFFTWFCSKDEPGIYDNIAPRQGKGMNTLIQSQVYPEFISFFGESRGDLFGDAGDIFDDNRGVEKTDVLFQAGNGKFSDLILPLGWNAFGCS